MITKETVEEIRSEHNRQRNEWTGCSWNQDFALGEKRPLYTDEWNISYIKTTAEDVARNILADDSESADPSWDEGDKNNMIEAVKKAQAYLRQCDRDAAQAEELMTEAMAAFERGEYGDAADQAKEAADLERSYGDAPTWGGLARLLEETRAQQMTWGDWYEEQNDLMHHEDEVFGNSIPADSYVITDSCARWICKRDDWDTGCEKLIPPKFAGYDDSDMYAEFCNAIPGEEW